MPMTYNNRFCSEVAVAVAVVVKFYIAFDD